jgi:hypothetical protein
MGKVYAVIHVEIGTTLDDEVDLDFALANLKEDVEDFIGSEWSWHLEDVVTKTG